MIVDPRLHPIMQRIYKVQERIDQACQQAQRDSTSVSILLATKSVAINDIQIGLSALQAIGQHHVMWGENKAQELVQKAPQLQMIMQNSEFACASVQQHFIGQLQSNKVAAVCRFADCIASVDRLSLAQKIQQYCQQYQRTQKIFIQVNTSGEATKAGIAPQELYKLLDEITALPRLQVQGLMTIGLHSQNEYQVRTGFAHLREYAVKAMERGLLAPSADQLSMGMSADLEWAILEGATIIRIGSAIFGKRIALHS